MAILLHALAIAGLLWIAREVGEVAPPPIAVELLVEPDPGPQITSPAPPRAPTPSPPPPQPLPQPIAPARPPVARAPKPRAEPRPAPAPRATEPSAGTSTAPLAPAPSAPAFDRVFAEAEVDAVAAPNGRIVPRYPPREQMLGREGTVVLAVTVEATGRVRETRVVESGGGGFDAAAREAVVKAPFHAARRAGQAVASRVNVRVRFQLD